MESRDLSKVVAKAKKNDSAALEKLYSSSHDMAYFTAVSIVKNEQDALDVVQDSYITAFSKLGELKDNSLFIGWLKTIVANNCKNLLKHKNPMLFNSEEEEANTLENIEEQSEDFLPASYIEQSAKREEVMDIINELSDVQKATILFYYYDELSIHEIAQAMDCTESTVTSRISYAKKHIKTEVEKLEKKGDKLYTMTVPVPFLRKLFIEESKNHIMPETVAKTVFNNAMSASGVVGAGSVTSMAGAAGLFTKFMALGTLGKCVVAGVAATVIVGGSVAGVAIKQNQDKVVVPTTATVSSSMVSPSSALEVSSQTDSDTGDTYGHTSTGDIAVKSNNTASKPSTNSMEDQIRQDLKNSGYTDKEIEDSIASLKKDGTLPSGTSSTVSKPSTTSSKPSTTSSKPTTSKPSTSKPSTGNSTDYNYTGSDGAAGGYVASDDGWSESGHGTGTGGGSAGDGDVVFG